jgi:[acyl-carrier-protein] S-malonyltransferase
MSTMNKVACVFPGQGSQYTGMGRELYDRFEESRRAFDAADRALGFPLAELCFEGPDERLALTENTQPAILATSIAAWRALQARGVRADAVGGHSLGEYSALVAAGAIPFEQALAAVRRRGRLMQEAVGVGAGAMAAVMGIDRAEVERICREAAGGEVVSPANVNSAQQIVIAGHAAAVERAAEACRAAGARRVKSLPVSAPFHCALMDPVAERLRPVLDELDFRDPAVPVFTNVDARPSSDAIVLRESLVRQVAAPVLWLDQVEAMIASGVGTFVEIGPGKVLSGLVRRIDKSVRTLNVADPAGVEEAVAAVGAGRGNGGAS